MRLVEIPYKTLEDELIALQGFVASESGQHFIMGASVALNWLLTRRSVAPSQFLQDAVDIEFKQ